MTLATLTHVATLADTSVVGPEQPGTIRHSTARVDSTTITDPDPAAPAKPALGPSRTWSALRTQFSFDKSAQVRLYSSHVIEPEESVLPPVLEEWRADVFTPSPSPRPSRAASTTATAPSTTDTVTSMTDTAPDTDSEAKDHRRQKRAVATSDTSYSQEHRTTAADRHRCFKRHHLGTPILLSNNDRQPVHPTQGIPDSRSPRSRDGPRSSHHPVQHYTNPTEKDQSPRPRHSEEKREVTLRSQRGSWHKGGDSGNTPRC